MRAPSRNLSVAIAVAAWCWPPPPPACRSCSRTRSRTRPEGPGDLWLFLSQFVSSLQTAAGLVLAARGVVGVVWSAASDRGLA